MTRTHPLTAVAADDLLAGGQAAGVVVAERDDRRVTLILSLHVWEATDGPAVPPANPKDALMALVYLDDGHDGAVTPSWQRHTYALRAGQTLTLSRQTPPLPSSRVTAALSVAAGVTLGDYRVQLTVAEYGDTSC